LNAVTDVPGVRVGHVTIRDGEVNTGVTVVVPYAEEAENALYCWGKHLVNSQGEMTGLQVVEDFGLMASPVFMTNLLSLGRIYNGAITYGFTRGKGLPIDGGWPPLVMGFDDRALNDLRRRVLTEAHALEAIEKAQPGAVEEGTVGAGTGATAFGFKGGIGTASRRVDLAAASYHVGILTLAHHGRRADLILDGIPVGRALPDPPPLDNAYPSVLGVVATDAPLTPRHLDALARRAVLGWTKTGSLTDPDASATVLAFSTGLVLRSPDEGPEYRRDVVADAQTADLYAAVTEAAEESVLNALFKATTLTGRAGRTAEAISRDAVERVMETYRVGGNG
jgi:D-aminopeptidase